MKTKKSGGKGTKEEERRRVHADESREDGTAVRLGMLERTDPAKLNNHTHPRDHTVLIVSRASSIDDVRSVLRVKKRAISKETPFRATTGSFRSRGAVVRGECANFSKISRARDSSVRARRPLAPPTSGLARARTTRVRDGSRRRVGVPRLLRARREHGVARASARARDADETRRRGDARRGRRSALPLRGSSRGEQPLRERGARRGRRRGRHPPQARARRRRPLRGGGFLGPAPPALPAARAA